MNEEQPYICPLLVKVRQCCMESHGVRVLFGPVFPVGILVVLVQVGGKVDLRCFITSLSKHFVIMGASATGL